MRLKTALAVGLLAGGISGAAVAADPLVAIDYDDSFISPTSVFDWDGLYAGGLVGLWAGNGTYIYGGGLIGVNYTVDGFLLGAEARGVFYSDGDLGGDLAGRIGVIFDQWLLFGTLGIGIRDGSTHVFAGGGAEVALWDNLSLAGQAEFVTGSSFNAIRADVSLRYHFL